MDFNTGLSKFHERMDELKVIADLQKPLVFLCAASFIEYLSKLAYGEDRGKQGYTAFISNWMSKIRPQYKEFIFPQGGQDLPDQMYYVLRCGIVHSFSLIPDHRVRKNPGRDHSIILLHRQESVERGILHLSQYSKAPITNAAAFVAEDFVDDIMAVGELLFNEAGTDPTLKKNIEDWLSKHPFISGDY